MKTKKLISAVLVGLLLFSLMGTAIAADDFTDVASNHPYYDAIEFCHDHNYINGTTATTFEPDASLTRGQLAVILCRAELLQSVKLDVTKGNFSDIAPLNDYYDAAAIIMGCIGAINGTSENTFSPNENVTREQLAAIITRLLKLGAINEDAYTMYTDSASISEYARMSVSSCLNAAVFAGLYDGEKFMPKSAVTRGELCKLIHTVSQPSYTVSIASMSGGTVTATPTKARPGALIKLTVTPDKGNHLVAGSLKVNGTAIDGTTFTMPAEDVTVKAKFEQNAALVSIAVTTEPTKMTYVWGEKLDLSGLVVTATYADSSTAVVTDYTTDPVAGDALTPSTSPSDFVIKIAYKENSVEKKTKITVTVNPKES